MNATNAALVTVIQLALAAERDDGREVDPREDGEDAGRDAWVEAQYAALALVPLTPAAPPVSVEVKASPVNPYPEAA